jgi:hypothetical protein
LIGIVKKLVGNQNLCTCCVKLTIVDDDHIETMIRVQYHLESQDTEDTSRTEAIESTASAADGHGLNEKGILAGCRRNSSFGLVDCSACLDEAWNSLHDVLDSKTCDTARELLAIVRQSKCQGTKKSEVMVCRLQVFSQSVLTDDITRIHLLRLPPIFRSF